MIFKTHDLHSRTTAGLVKSFAKFALCLGIATTMAFELSCSSPTKRTPQSFGDQQSWTQKDLHGSTPTFENPLRNSQFHATLFDWPVDSARLSRGFLPRGTKKKKKPHLGIDLAAPRGTPILAAQNGVIIYTGREFKGYGKMIMIENGNGWATLYAHLDKFFVTEGQKVRRGEVIGAMGNTGRSTGSHLHFEIRRQSGPIDPLPFLPAGIELAQRNQHPLTSELDYPDPESIEE